MRWLGVRHAVCACFRPGFCCRFLVGKPLLELPLTPRRLIHPQQPLVHVVADDVVKRGAVIRLNQHDHANLVVGHERNLRVKPRQVPAVKRQQFSSIRGRLASHSVRGIQDFPISQGFAGSVWQRNRGLQRGFQHTCRQYLLPVVFPFVHQRNQPVRQFINIRNDRARGSHAFRVLVIRNLIKLEGIPLLAERYAIVGLLQHVGDGVASRAHAERCENSLTHEIFPPLSGLHFNDLSRRRKHQVVIKERLAHRLLRLQVFQPLEQLFARKRRLEPDQIVPRHPCAVRKHVV